MLECFVAPIASANASGSPPTANRSAKLLFAAMIGVRMLKEVAGDAGWINELRDAVLEAAAVAE